MAGFIRLLPAGAESNKNGRYLQWVNKNKDRLRGKAVFIFSV